MKTIFIFPPEGSSLHTRQSSVTKAGVLGHSLILIPLLRESLDEDVSRYETVGIHVD